MQNEQEFSQAISQSLDIESAVDDFIATATRLGQPFSSGHITTALRVYRPSFRFRHAEIGEIVRDRFYQGEVVFGGNIAVQEPRVCVGLGRTPSGTTVMVYAPSRAEAVTFPFEIDIPEVGSGLIRMPMEHPVQSGVAIKPTLPSAADMKATVLSDHRLCVPRAALEALLFATNQSFRADQRVWVAFAGDHVVISLDQRDGAVDYGVQSTRGRILFPKAGSGQFNHGDIFPVEVQGDTLRCNISKPL